MLPLVPLQPPELLMVGISAIIYRTDNIVKKIYRTTDEIPITKQNIIATRNEATIYSILGDHPRYVDAHRTTTAIITDTDSRHWAHQMIESIAFIHSMGIRHSDLRLDQWLLDTDLNARLSDFNRTRFNGKPDLKLKGFPVLGIEKASHYLPRGPEMDNTVESDLFALGSALYELVAGHETIRGTR
ncbi:MAG: hypothetical protein M1834_009492 [Cirrosporium novae-zelandiae]|nr:MAG: hypothetical protein M1834_009492 [Cirrosporium novae-zelandiae]